MDIGDGGVAVLVAVGLDDWDCLVDAAVGKDALDVVAGGEGEDAGVVVGLGTQVFG